MIDNKFKGLESYFKNYFNNVDPHIVGNPVFTNNGTSDLEREGLSGYSVWVGYKHKGSRSSSVFEKKLKAFIRNEVIPAFEEFITESGETFETGVVVEDFTSTTDMFRLYATCNKEVRK